MLTFTRTVSATQEEICKFAYRSWLLTYKSEASLKAELREWWIGLTAEDRDRIRTAVEWGASDATIEEALSTPLTPVQLQEMAKNTIEELARKSLTQVPRVLALDSRARGAEIDKVFPEMLKAVEGGMPLEDALVKFNVGRSAYYRRRLAQEKAPAKKPAPPKVAPGEVIGANCKQCGLKKPFRWLDKQTGVCTNCKKTLGEAFVDGFVNGAVEAPKIVRPEPECKSFDLTFEPKEEQKPLSKAYEKWDKEPVDKEDLENAKATPPAGRDKELIAQFIGVMHRTFKFGRFGLEHLMNKTHYSSGVCYKVIEMMVAQGLAEKTNDGEKEYWKLKKASL